MYFSFITFFSVFRHNPGPTVCFSHFARCSVFLAIFQVLPCEFLIFILFHFPAIFQVLQCVFLILHIFLCFSPHSRSYSVCSSFSTFFSFFTIIEDLQCVFFNVHVFQFFCHIPPTVFESHFKRFFFCLFCFLAIIDVLQCVNLIFHVFECSCHIPDQTVFVSHYPLFLSFLATGPTVWISHLLRFSLFLAIFQELSVCFSFCTFFSVSRHISHSNVCVSHFPLFSVFLPYSMFYILQFSFSKVLSFSCHILGPTVCVCVSFSTLFRVSHHIPAPIVWVSHFFRFPCFSLYSRSYNVHFLFFTLFQVFSPYFTS